MKHFLFLTLVLPQTALAVLPLFTDVDPSSPFFNRTLKLKQRGITTGCWLDPPQFCAASNITRGQAAVLFIRSLYSSGYAGSSGNAEAFNHPTAVSFPNDVGAGHPQFRWIQQMKSLGFTDNGCGGGYYCPDQTHTFAEMAVFLVRGHQLRTGQPLHTPTCADLREENCGLIVPGLPSSHWAYWFGVKAIDLIGNAALGCAPNFCPDTAVTRGAASAYLADGLLSGTLPDAQAPTPPGIETPNCSGTSQSTPTFLVKNSFFTLEGTTYAESEYIPDPSNKPQSPELWSLNLSQRCGSTPRSTVRQQTATRSPAQA